MTLGTGRLVIEIGEAATQTPKPYSIAIQGQRSVGADGKAGGDWSLDGGVELELVVGNDFTGTVLLVGEDTVLQADDGVGGADGFDRGRDIVGDVVGSDFEGAIEVFTATVGVLT